MTTFKSSSQPVFSGLHIPYNVGYDATHTSIFPNADQVGASGYLQRDSDRATISLWVTEVTMDFAVSGETGQSQALREFFPRNFQDVKLNIQGNTSNTTEYNRLATFVRESHLNMINAVRQNAKVAPTVTFHLDNTYGNGQSWPTPKRGVKGPHQPLTVQGYIQKIDAGAHALEVAPAFNLDFVILAASEGLFQETETAVSVLSDILKLIDVQKVSDRTQGRGFVTPTSVPAQGVKSVVNTVDQAVWSVAAGIKHIF